MKSNDLKRKDQKALARRVWDDLVDVYDEELELELEDRYATGIDDTGSRQGDGDTDGQFDRKQYFRELFRLQSELIKL